MGGLSYSSGGYLTAGGAILQQWWIVYSRSVLPNQFEGDHFRRACLSLNSASGPFIIDFTYSGALMFTNSTTVTGSQA